ncbi:ankyrin repeat-containing domain protein [Trichoderma chlorosporum]
MDPVSLAVGIVGLAGLFSTCLDLAEKVDNYKHFKNDEQILATQFVSFRLRFEKWGKALGLDQAALSEDRHEALVDVETLETVRKIIDIIHNILNDQKRPSPNPAVIPTRNLARSLAEPFRISLGSRKEKLSWALKGKEKRESQVELFGKLVQHLYHLVPTESITRATTVDRNQQPATTVQIDDSWTAELRDTLQRLDLKTNAETRRELHAWIVRHPPSEIYEDATQKRLDGTCEWILERPVFEEWLFLPSDLEAPRLLWINGPAGFGKTILCSRIVQRLQTTVKAPVASYFFSSDFEGRDDPYEAIRWWISEVISRSQPAFEHVHMAREKQDGPSATRAFILQLFSEIVKIVPGCVFVIDGLDECTWLNKGNNSGRRDSIAKFLENLDRAIANTSTRVLIVSRDESEIRSGIEDMESTIFEHRVLPEDVDSDARHYARSIVDKKLSKKTESLKSDISGRMAMKCGGQFLWLKLQEDSLRSWKNQKQLQDAIDQTPSGLDSLYHRNWVRLSSLPKDEKDRAFSLLRWVTFAIRPLTIAEIAEAVLINIEHEELATDELPDLIDDDYVNSEILGIGGSLLNIRRSSTGLDPRVDTIRLTHFSVKQYFLSHDSKTGDTLQANEKLRSSNERIENITLAQLCLRYIHYEEVWHFERSQELEQVQGSFRDYAAGYWHHHAHNGIMEDELVNDLVASLFDGNGTIWKPWKRWFDDGERMRMEAYLEIGDDDERAKRQATLSKSMPNNPIYYTSKLDLTSITFRLIEEYRHQLDENSYFGETAIAVACQNGNQAITQALIDAGANIQLASFEGETPLHMAATQGHLNIVTLLLKNGADHNAINNSSATALHYAAHGGYTDIVKILLQYGADYLVQNFQGLIPLHHAAGRGHTDVVKALISHDSDQLHMTERNSQTPLHTAAINGKLESVELLLNHGDNISVVDGDGYTPLMSASFFGFTEVVRTLLDWGSEVNMSDPRGISALGFAASNGHTKTVELLLEKGADFTLQESTIGWTALQSAAYNGHVDIVRALLVHGADLHFTSADGYDALLYAAEGGQTAVIKVLFEHGANISASQLKKANTPLGMAIREGHYEVVEFFFNNGASYNWVLEDELLPLTMASYEGHLSIVELLLSLGANLEEMTANGLTPLSAAITNNRVDVVKFLLERGADISVVDSSGSTALTDAIYRGNAEIVKLLLDNDAEYTSRDDQGWKPLNLAAHGGHVQIIKLLLGKGSDITETDADGWTPLHAAADGGHLDALNFLLSKGLSPAALDHSGKTALHLACLKGHQSIAEVLLGLSTLDEISCFDDHQRTPLFYAAMRGHAIISKLLLSKAIDMHKTDFYASTALFSAVRNGHEEVVGQLLACIGGMALDSKDAFGKSVFYWAQKSKHDGVIELLCPFNASQTTDEFDSAPENNCMPFDRRAYWCDICTRCIPIGAEHFQCTECEDFLACVECIGAGAKCIEDKETHQWIVAPEQLDVLSDDESSLDEE